MSNWIQLDPETLNRVTTEHVDGIEISVGMSPYDLPDGVRGRYSKQIDRFVIRFRYLGKAKEEYRPVATSNPNIVFMVGVHSGRLHEIHVDVKSAGTDKVSLQMLVPQLESAIEALGSRIPRRTKNFAVARDVISEKGEQLFREHAFAE